MFYNQYPYNIFNQNYLNSYNNAYNHSDDEIKEHHNNQLKNIVKMRKAISDYINAARQVSPDYQTIAFEACIDEIIIQASKDNSN